MINLTPNRNSFLCDAAQEAAERTTQTYAVYRQEVSEHAPQRCAHKMDLYRRHHG